MISDAASYEKIAVTTGRRFFFVSFYKEKGKTGIERKKIMLTLCLSFEGLPKIVLPK